MKGDMSPSVKIAVRVGGAAVGRHYGAVGMVCAAPPPRPADRSQRGGIAHCASFDAAVSQSRLVTHDLFRMRVR